MGKISSVVLLSGGMDSCVTAAMALRDLQAEAPMKGTHAAFLHVTYGQRTAARERQAFLDIAAFYSIHDRMVADIEYLRRIGGSALTDTRIEVPISGLLKSAEESSGPKPTERQGSSRIPVTYVPFRNTHLLAIGVSWAEAIGARQIYIGAVAEDSSGYPDCRPEYYRTFNELIRVGTRPETRLEVVTPLIGMRKPEIVRRGFELVAPLHLTWSCYQNEDIACGTCDSCVLRRRAFRQAEVEDPVPYATDGRQHRVAPFGQVKEIDYSSR